jgi:hypothetical protein
MRHLPIAVLLIVIIITCLPAVSQDAAMFRGNLQHMGIYEATGVPQFSKIKWKFHTGGRVISSPAVAHGLAMWAARMETSMPSISKLARRNGSSKPKSGCRRLLQ